VTEVSASFAQAGYLCAVGPRNINQVAVLETFNFELVSDVSDHFYPPVPPKQICKS
jgi:hypothetical protein